MGNPQYRVLQVVAGMNRGGTETMLMNHYRALDREKVQFDFLVHTDKECAYDKEIESLGGRIYHAMPIRPWRYLQYFRWLNNFFAEHAHEFIAVHGHIQENTGFALHYAKKYGIANRLMSSHTAPKTLDYKFIFREFARFYFQRSATTYLACGVDAGKYLYRGHEFIVMKNAIESDKFKFNQEKRLEVRRKLGISDSESVIGHVGRFGPEKNHTFIIDLFKEFYKVNHHAKLVLVGDGCLINRIKKQVADEHIENNVLFLGLRSDIYDLLQAFDVYLMPSLYEGLPVSVIEAQAAGLPCVLSTTVDDECDVTGNVSFISLDAPKSIWIKAIMDNLSRQRVDCQQSVIKAGYDVNNNLKTLLPLYGIK